MKRSEAIEKLTDDLMCYYESEDEAKFYAKSFLSSVESLGMIPPYPAGPYNPEELVNDWEPEDET